MSTGDQSEYLRKKMAERRSQYDQGGKFMKTGYQLWAENERPARQGGAMKEGLASASMSAGKDIYSKVKSLGEDMFAQYYKGSGRHIPGDCSDSSSDEESDMEGGAMAAEVEETSGTGYSGNGYLKTYANDAPYYSSSLKAKFKPAYDDLWNKGAYAGEKVKTGLFSSTDRCDPGDEGNLKLQLYEELGKHYDYDDRQFNPGTDIGAIVDMVIKRGVNGKPCPRKDGKGKPMKAMLMAYAKTLPKAFAKKKGGRRIEDTEFPTESKMEANAKMLTKGKGIKTPKLREVVEEKVEGTGILDSYRDFSDKAAKSIISSVTGKGVSMSVKSNLAKVAEEAAKRVSGTGKGTARAAIVKKIMKEKGLSLPQASKYVKEHGLYKA